MRQRALQPITLDRSKASVVKLPSREAYSGSPGGARPYGSGSYTCITTVAAAFPVTMSGQTFRHQPRLSALGVGSHLNLLTARAGSRPRGARDSRSYEKARHSIGSHPRVHGALVSRALAGVMLTAATEPSDQLAWIWTCSWELLQTVVQTGLHRKVHQHP